MNFTKMVIGENDYYVYKIAIEKSFSSSLKRFFSRKKFVIFIERELVKKHPFFTESCLWKVLFIDSAKEKTAIVLVMEKETYNAYKRKKTVCFFEGKEYSLFKKKKLSLLITMIVFFSGILLFLFIKNGAKQKLIENSIQINSTILRGKKIEDDFRENLFIRIASAFEICSKRGSIDRILYNSQSDPWLSIHSRGMYPEELEALFPSAFCLEVGYDKTIPITELILSYPEKKIEQDSSIPSTIEISYIRTLIKKYDGILIFEHYSDGTVQWCLKKSQWQSFYSDLKKLCTEYFLDLVFMDISLEHENDARISGRFAKTSYVLLPPFSSIYSEKKVVKKIYMKKEDDPKKMALTLSQITTLKAHNISEHELRSFEKKGVMKRKDGLYATFFMTDEYKILTLCADCPF